MSFLRRLFGFHGSDVPVRLWAMTPTVPPEAVAKLAARPVRRPTGSKVVFLFGAHPDQPPAQRSPQSATASVGHRRDDGSALDYEESTIFPKPIPIDLEDLPV